MTATPLHKDKLCGAFGNTYKDVPYHFLRDLFLSLEDKAQGLSPSWLPVQVMGSTPVSLLPVFQN